MRLSPSIPARVFLSFITLLLAFGVVSSLMVLQVRSLGRTVSDLHATLLPLPTLVAELRSELTGMGLVLDQTDPTSLRRSVHVARRVHPHLERMERLIERIESSLKAGQTPRDGLLGRLSELKVAHQGLSDLARTFFDEVEQERPLEDSRQRTRKQLSLLGREAARFELELSMAVDTAIARFRVEEQRAAWSAIFLVSVAMVLGAFLTFSAARLLRPLGTLRAAVARLAQGHFDVPVPTDGAGEIGALAAEFARMAEGLKLKDLALEAKQRALLHNERLATVGRMSSQITHELRNPLSSIGLNSELLLEELQSAGHELASQALLENIIKEVERLREITEAYLGFARLPRPELQPLDLNHLCAELLDFVRTEMEQGGVRTRMDGDPAGRFALADPNQLRAALLNLVRNAREALDGRGGHVVLRVRTLGEHATVEVTDDGPGFAGEASAHLFEPFFSTKPQGTGLGLSMVRQILVAQGGEVTIHSEPGRGATVRLTLPLAPEEERLMEEP